MRITSPRGVPQGAEAAIQRGSTRVFPKMEVAVDIARDANLFEGDCLTPLNQSLDELREKGGR